MKTGTAIALGIGAIVGAIGLVSIVSAKSHGVGTRGITIRNSVVTITDAREAIAWGVDVSPPGGAIGNMKAAAVLTSMLASNFPGIVPTRVVIPQIGYDQTWQYVLQRAAPLTWAEFIGVLRDVLKTKGIG